MPRINNKIVDNNAYITIGDPYRDPSRNVPDRWKGKQFQVDRIPKNEENGYFSTLKYHSDPYHEMELYAFTQPSEKRKLGFNSRDAHKRDEFTSAIRTEQYRETLQKELRLLDLHRNIEEEEEILRKYEEEEKKKKENTRRLHNYDQHRNNKTDEWNPRQKRDTFYQTSRNQEKRLGNFRTSTSDIGNGAWNQKYVSPKYGPISHVKNFYDRGHLNIG